MLLRWAVDHVVPPLGQTLAAEKIPIIRFFGGKFRSLLVGGKDAKNRY